MVYLFRRQVSFKEGEDLAKEHGLMFLETSALTSCNIKDAFLLSAHQILQIKENKSKEQLVSI